MKKKYRLLKSKDFKQVLDKRQKIYTNSWTCFYKQDKNIENIKIGIIIPKKKCKSSVKRNYLKRIFWFLSKEEEIKKLPKFKCIFFYNKSFFDNLCSQKLPIESLNEQIKKIYANLTQIKQ